MSKNNSLFSQLLQFFPRRQFDQLVSKHKAEFASKGFSCWSQFVSMMFCQFASAKSLSEICNGLASCEGKLNHLGIKAPKKSTLSYVNANRPWELYQDLFFYLLQHTNELARSKRRKFRFKKKLYSIDSTTIDLCLSMYEWAKFRTTKGAVKIHLRLDHEGYLPDYAVITDGKVADVNALVEFGFTPETITTFDRGYNDYGWYGYLTEIHAYYVTRLKDNALFKVVEDRPVAENAKGVISDQIISFTSDIGQQSCPYNQRLVIFYDEEQDRTFEFLTNNLDLAASTIAAIYKDRWAIESFFKALKQNFKIKTFVGTSPNAVKTQIWTALICILILMYLRLKSTFSWSLSNLVALLRMNLFKYNDLWEWVNNPYGKPNKPDESIQCELCFT